MNTILLLAAACTAPIHQDQGTVTSYYGWRILMGRAEKTVHTGIDIRAKIGTPVRASRGGRVTFAEMDKRGGGLMVDITTRYEGQTWVFRYAHLSKITVQKGQRVKAGEMIGRVGSTGNSTGPHLHFETIVKRPGKNDLYRNPERFVCKYPLDIRIPHFKFERRIKIGN